MARDKTPTLGEVFAAFRHRRGLSQRQLANLTFDESIGKRVVSASHIAHIEKYNLGLRADKLDLLARLLELSAEEHQRLRDLAGIDAPSRFVSTSDRLDVLEERVDRIEQGLAAVEDRLTRRRPGRQGDQGS